MCIRENFYDRFVSVFIKSPDVDAITYTYVHTNVHVGASVDTQEGNNATSNVLCPTAMTSQLKNVPL